jgi:lipopolysaccharide transport system ATP-binding protein
LEFEYWNSDPASYISTSFSLFNEQGVLLFAIATPFDSNWRRKPCPTGLLSSGCQIPGDFLNDGLHRVSLIVLRNHVPVIEEPEALLFHIEDGSMDERDGWYGKWPGVIRPRLDWKTEVVLTPVLPESDKS